VIETALLNTAVTPAACSGEQAARGGGLPRLMIRRGGALLALTAALCLWSLPGIVSAADATPPVDATKPITLDEAVKIARQNQGSVAVAQQSAAAATQRVRQARTGTMPSVTGDVSYNVSGDTSRASGGDFRTSSQSSNGAQPRVSLNYTLYDGGLTQSSVRQAQANAAASSAGVDSVLNSLTFMVSQDFFNQLRAERTLDLRREQERLADEQLKSVEARIQAGSAADADRALPLSELRNRQVDRIQAENDLRTASTLLRNAMGLEVGAPLKLTEPPEANAAPPSLESLIQTAQRQRPEVLQAKARVQAAEAAVSSARISRLPRVDSTVTGSMTPEDNSRRREWVAGLSVSMPLFDAGLTHAREEESKASLRSTQADMDQTVKDVASDVESAYNSLSSARERVTAAKLALDAAKVNLDSTTERYNLGSSGSSVLSLVTAQVQYATAANSSIGAQFDLRVAQAQLEQAIGARK